MKWIFGDIVELLDHPIVKLALPVASPLKGANIHSGIGKPSNQSFL